MFLSPSKQRRNVISDDSKMTSRSTSYNKRFNVGKPPLPYSEGKCLKARSHRPSKPINFNCVLELEGVRERESIDPVQRCLMHPPSPGSFTDGEVELEIVKPVQAGDKLDSQSFAVRVVSTTSTLDLPSNDCPDLLMAKIYDPLYFDHEQDDANPFLCVESAYTHECAAYSKLVDFQGNIIPKFYGSFSLSLPVDRQHLDNNYRDSDSVNTREVRLILMELVPGTCMRDLSPSDYSQSDRQAIMKSIIDSETALYTHDLDYGDVHPDNILVSNPQSPLDHARKIVIADFGQAWTGRSGVPEWETYFLPGVKISPLLRWIDPCKWFNEWVDWDWKSWIEENYEHDRASITEEMQRKWGPSLKTQ